MEKEYYKIDYSSQHINNVKACFFWNKEILRTVELGSDQLHELISIWLLAMGMLLRDSLAELNKHGRVSRCAEEEDLDFQHDGNNITPTAAIYERFVRKDGKPKPSAWKGSRIFLPKSMAYSIKELETILNHAKKKEALGKAALHEARKEAKNEKNKS